MPFESINDPELARLLSMAHDIDPKRIEQLERSPLPISLSLIDESIPVNGLKTKAVTKYPSKVAVRNRGFVVDIGTSTNPSLYSKLVSLMHELDHIRSSYLPPQSSVSQKAIDAIDPVRAWNMLQAVNVDELRASEAVPRYHVDRIYDPNTWQALSKSDGWSQEHFKIASELKQKASDVAKYSRYNASGSQWQSYVQQALRAISRAKGR